MDIVPVLTSHDMSIHYVLLYDCLECMFCMNWYGNHYSYSLANCINRGKILSIFVII